MRVRIVGIKESQTKNKKDCYTYFFERPFSAYDVENSECSGVAVGNEFSYKKYEVKPGDEVDLMYEPGYEGRAMLSDIIMVNPHIPRDSKKQA